MLVDVDSPLEFAREHMRGAINIPLPEINRRAVELDHRQPVVVCAHGKLQATRAAPTLRGLGFYEVIDIGRAIL